MRARRLSGRQNDARTSRHCSGSTVKFCRLNSPPRDLLSSKNTPRSSCRPAGGIVQCFPRPRSSGSRKRTEWGACCCSMSTRRSPTRRRLVQSATRPSRSCREKPCSRPASVVRKTRQPDGGALGSDRPGGGAGQTESAAARDGTRILGGPPRTKFPMASRL